MIQIFRLLKKHFSYCWYCIEYLNGLLVGILYGRKIAIAVQKISGTIYLQRYIYRPLVETDLPMLANLLNTQPNGFDRYFKPHPFDLNSLQRQFRNPSFLMLGAFDDKRIIGYFFIRFFVNRKAFRGKMVDSYYQNQGIAKQMGLIMTDIAFNAGFSLFATISQANLSSIASSKAVNKIRIIKELPDNYIYVQYMKLKS